MALKILLDRWYVQGSTYFKYSQDNMGIVSKLTFHVERPYTSIIGIQIPDVQQGERLVTEGENSSLDKALSSIQEVISDIKKDIESHSQ